MTRHITWALVVAMTAVTWPPAETAAQTKEMAMKPFVMPPLEAPAGPVDLRTVFTGPRGKLLPPVGVSDGHFTAGGKRVRFWGVNLCFGACFPTHDVADKIAARMAAFGINCVRFHHMDANAFPRGIWKKDFSGLSDEALDRLDYLLAALKREGIYANINLHVSRDFSKTGSDATPEELGSYGKVVCIFDPELIDLQKRYARDLLSHKNAYTGLRLADDPVVGLVEISNENSAVLAISRSKPDGLPPRYEAMLTQLWNQWLKARYKTDDSLRAAWSAGAEPRGAEMLRGTDFSQAKLDTAWGCGEIGKARMNATTAGGAVRLAIEKTTDTEWHLQFRQVGPKVIAGKTYTVSFRARCDKPRRISVGLQQSHEPWKMLGLSWQVNLRPQWRTFSMGFKATGDEADAKFAFSVGQEPGTVFLDDISLVPGGRDGLRADESLAKGSVRRLLTGQMVTEARGADFMRFLAHLDISFFVGMRDFLRDELGVRAPITGTEGFSLLSDFVQSHLDFVDGHAYWQHPRFPNRPWDPKDWTIPNTAMVDDPAGSTLVNLAFQRVRQTDDRSPARPFTVTEYNHSAPNDCQAEGIPMIATFAAAQDWDGIFLFAYSHSSRWTEDHVRSFFDISHSPVKMVQMAAGALLFRREDIAVPTARVVTHIPPDQMFTLFARHGPWSSSMADAKELQALPQWRFFAPYSVHFAPLLLDAVGASMGDSGATQPPTVIIGSQVPGELPKDDAAGVLWKSADDTLTWSARGSHTGIYTARGERSVAVVGFAAGKPQTVGPVEITLQSPAFAAITLSSLDGKPLTESTRILVTACGRMENTGQTWNADRTSVTNQWGRGPTLVEPVRATITLKRTGRAGAMTLIALDGTGKAAGEWAVANIAAPGGSARRFRLGTGPATLWYVLGPGFE